MGLLAYPFLALIHIVYSLVIATLSLFRHLTRPNPSHLEAARRRVPKHLAILLVPDAEIDSSTTERCFIDSVRKSIKWCQQTGIDQLSVYDAEGMVLNNIEYIRAISLSESLLKDTQPNRSRIHYPPTPPLSDYSDSRPLSPALEASEDHRSWHTLRISNRIDSSARLGDQTSRPLTLHIVSRDASKPSLAYTTRSIARTERRNSKISTANRGSFKLSINTLEHYLEGKNGLPAPDFMIIHPVHPSKYHRSPIELHGYPPWQIRLTELYCNRFRKQYEARLMWFLPSHIQSALLASTLTEWEFREALDQFASAEMRLGK